MHPVEPQVKILIIEDDEDDFFIIRDFIRSIPGQQFIIDWCFRYQEALDHIRNCHYNIYFADYLLGEKNGLDLLRDIKEHHCEEPVILLTGITRHEVDVMAMQEGAADYLVKDELNTDKLERCIRYNLERTLHKKALQANERKFHGFFEKSKDAIFLADENLRFREVNTAAADLFNYSKKKIEELGLFDLVADGDSRMALEEKWQRDQKIENHEAELRTATGEKIHAVISASTETDAKGDKYGQGIIRDITHLKRIEKANALIEKLRSTGKLLRILAHEVRNPLTNIGLATNHLQSEFADGEMHIYLDIIERNRHRIEVLIAQLLDSARPGEISLSRTSLQDIVEKTVAAANDRIALKKIQVEISGPAEPVYIMADAEKFKIAFFNILINAIEAVDANTGYLQISIESRPHYAILLLQDNGNGIAEENLTRIFEPYFTSKSNGFGLGLSTALAILQSHHASVDVQSQPGKGTRFILTMKKVQEEMAPTV